MVEFSRLKNQNLLKIEVRSPKIALRSSLGEIFCEKSEQHPAKNAQERAKRHQRALKRAQKQKGFTRFRKQFSGGRWRSKGRPRPPRSEQTQFNKQGPDRQGPNCLCCHRSLVSTLLSREEALSTTFSESACLSVFLCPWLLRLV